MTTDHVNFTYYKGGLGSSVLGIDSFLVCVCVV